MTEVTVQEAASELSKYVERALHGEDILICAQDCAVRLIPVHHESPGISDEQLAALDDREFNHYHLA
jgi:antitoxin (DNA-binding transcriptional repressor) of toxin-antitoxin stability system